MNHQSPSTEPATESPLQSVKPGIRGYWWAAAAAAILGTIMFWFDPVLSEPENLESMPGDLKRFISLSEIFAHGFGIAIIAIGIWLLIPDKRKYILRIVSCAAWPSLAVHAIKLMVGRRRPLVFFDENRQLDFPATMYETFLGWFPTGGPNTIYYIQSFPSGHAATTWGMAIGLTWVFPKGRWLFFVLALFASIQRVSSYAHWSSDVCFGACIGFIMGGALTHNWGLGKVLGKIENRSKAHNPEIV